MRIFLIGQQESVKCNRNYELFRKDLGRFHDVIFYGRGYRIYYNPMTSISEIINSYHVKPDILLVHAPHGRLRRRLRNDCLNDLNEINIPKVHITGDYICGGQLEQKYDQYLRYFKFDLIFNSVPKDTKVIKEKGFAPAVHVLPFSVDTTLFYDMGLIRSIDVMASFTKGSWYTNRKQIQHSLARMNLQFFLDRVCHQEYVETINKSKIFVCGNNINNNISGKYTEVLACNTLFIVNKPDELEEFGYEDGKHLVIYEDLKDMQEKVLYYLEHEEERKKIAQQGMEFVRANYSNDKIIQRFTEIVKKELL